MTIRWRQQELFVATIIALIFLLKFLLTGSGGEPVAGSFSHSAHTVMRTQELLPHLIIYACLILLNAVVIPWRQGRPGYTGWIIGFLLLSWLVIGLAIQYAFFCFVAREGVNIQRMDLAGRAQQIGYSRAGVIIIVYSLYLVLRIRVVSWVQREATQRELRTLVINQLTLVVHILFSCLMFAWVFGLPVADNLLVFTGILVIPSVVLIYYNAGFLFQAENDRGSSVGKIIGKIVLAATILAFVSMFIASLLFHQVRIEIFILCGLVYLLIAAPISWRVWLILRTQRNSVLRLQTDLGKASADLQFLRWQVNPHFLFNALNTIYGIALQENAPRAADASQRLGDMMRFMLQENTQDRIPLSRELDYLDNYISLQRLRIPSSETVTVEVSLDRAGDGLIAPMLLIPFVENAFKHGISFSRPSWIRLSVQQKDDWLQADFTNSRQPEQRGDTERFNTGVGLQNVRDRLTLLYPGRHELLIRENELEYAVHLRLRLN